MADGRHLGVLQDLAYWMTVVKNVSVISRPKAAARVQWKLGPDAAAAAADELLDHLIVRSGLLRITEEGVGFTSEVLCGYLAASEAVSGGTVDLLMREAHLVERQHLLVMAAGLTRIEVAEELLTGLLEEAGRDSSARDRLHLLIHMCLRTAPQVGRELQERIKTCCEHMAPRTLAEAESLAAAGPLVVDMLATQPLDNVECALAAIHAAKLVGGEDVLPFLARLARDERSAVTDALRAAATAFDDAEYGRVVLTRCGDATGVCVPDGPGIAGGEHGE